MLVWCRRQVASSVKEAVVLALSWWQLIVHRLEAAIVVGRRLG